MIDFLIKSTLSLFVLLAIYHLLLEKEKMHQFNRFYLLFCLVFSFVIPFISIEIIDESFSAVTPTINAVTANTIVTIVPETFNYTPIIIWSLYCIVTSLLLFRFVRNILRITSRTHLNTLIKYKNAKLVLLKEKTLPHTFWNTIFVNETEYCNQKIEEELYTHELIHVTQKHTLDVLLIEIVKTLFWFNPIFIFYKKAIQLNHEFLADEKVVNYFNNVPFYQALLLSKANDNQPFYLASNLNYLVTKKRFLMMTKNKSQTKETLKKIALLPVLTALFYGISFKTVAMKNPSSHSIQTKSNFYKNEVIKDKLRNKTQSTQKSDTVHIESKINSVTENKPLDTITEKNNVTVEIRQPEFPGGVLEFYKFIGTNFNIPDELKISGKIILTFMVEKDGSLSEFEIVKDLGFGTADEVIRVLKLSPKWIPGKENNEIVRVKYNIPIKIGLEKN
ncbi:MecR1 Antirepressor regulating drug resistance, predicted signal transduction N-terminal membrane component [Flavobacteriaceae bacterium]